MTAYDNSLTLRLGTTIGSNAIQPLSADALARVVWTHIARPNDAAVGELIGERGASAALSIVLNTTVPAAAGIDLSEIRANATKRYDPSSIAHALETAHATGWGIVTPGTPEWPASLDDLGDRAPYALWVRGDTSVLGRDKIALVGARASTGYGNQVSYEFAAGLAERGWVTVSTSSHGIAEAVQRATLAARGQTIAVLASGLSRVYPAANSDLYGRIAVAGALVTEIPPHLAATKWNLTARDRIVAALAERTVVVEAGHRSGTLSVARSALSLGRTVGAVPGPITSVQSSGCHLLLEDPRVRVITNIDSVTLP